MTPINVYGIRCYGITLLANGVTLESGLLHKLLTTLFEFVLSSDYHI